MVRRMMYLGVVSRCFGGIVVATTIANFLASTCDGQNQIETKSVELNISQILQALENGKDSEEIHALREIEALGPVAARATPRLVKMIENERYSLDAVRALRALGCDGHSFVIGELAASIENRDQERVSRLCEILAASSSPCPILARDLIELVDRTEDERSRLDLIVCVLSVAPRDPVVERWLNQQVAKIGDQESLLRIAGTLRERWRNTSTDLARRLAEAGPPIDFTKKVRYLDLLFALDDSGQYSTEMLSEGVYDYRYSEGPIVPVSVADLSRHLLIMNGRRAAEATPSIVTKVRERWESSAAWPCYEEIVVLRFNLESARGIDSILAEIAQSSPPISSASKLLSHVPESSSERTKFIEIKRCQVAAAEILHLLEPSNKQFKQIILENYLGVEDQASEREPDDLEYWRLLASSDSFARTQLDPMTTEVSLDALRSRLELIVSHKSNDEIFRWIWGSGELKIANDIVGVSKFPSYADAVVLDISAAEMSEYILASLEPLEGIEHLAQSLGSAHRDDYPWSSREAQYWFAVLRKLPKSVGTALSGQCVDVILDDYRPTFYFESIDYRDDLAIDVLAEVGDLEDSDFDKLLDGIKSDSRQISVASAEALGRLRLHPEKTLPHLAETLTDRRLVLRATALKSIGSFGKHAFGYLPEINEQMKSPWKTVRHAAVLAMARIICDSVAFLW